MRSTGNTSLLITIQVPPTSRSQHRRCERITTMPKPKKRQSKARRKGRAAVAASVWKRQTLLGLPGAPGDSFADLRGKLDVLASHAGEHCGLPVVIEGEKLVVEPSHPARDRK